MLIVAQLENDAAEADRRIRGALASGAGLEVFRTVIENQGGDPRVLDDYGLLPSAPDEARITARGSGYVRPESEAIGRAAVALGAGRSKLDDVVDPGVGVEIVARTGTQVSAGDVVLLVRHRGGRGLDAAQALLDAAITISDGPVPEPPLIVERVMHG